MPSRRSEDAGRSELLTTGQAAAVLGVRSVNTVKRWVRDGRLEGVRRGSRMLIRKQSVDRLLAGGTAQNGGTVRSRAGRAARRGEKLDVLSELTDLARGAARAEREEVGARMIGEIRRRVKPLLASRGISRAFLFGSAARGNIHRRSDIDIAVELPGDSTMDLIDFAGLALELEDALGRKVDLVNLATMKPGIKQVAVGEEVGLL